MSVNKQRVEAFQIIHILYKSEGFYPPLLWIERRLPPHLLSIMLLRLLLLLGLFLLELLHLIHPEVLHGFLWAGCAGAAERHFATEANGSERHQPLAVVQRATSRSGYQQDYVSGCIMESTEAEPERIVDCLKHLFLSVTWSADCRQCRYLKTESFIKRCGRICVALMSRAKRRQFFYQWIRSELFNLSCPLPLSRCHSQTSQ